MSNQGKDPKCQFWCWAIAALIGVFIFIMLQSVAGKSFIAALILGLIGFGLLGLLFNWLFCAPVPAMGEGSASKSSGAGTAAAAAGAGAVAATAATGSAASASSGTSAAAPSSAASSTASTSSASEASSGADSAASSDAAATSAATLAEASGASAVTAASEAKPAKIKPSAALAGEAELADRKGEYKYEAPSDPSADDTAAAKKGSAASGGKGKAAGKAKAANASGDAAAKGAAKTGAKGKAKAKAGDDATAGGAAKGKAKAATKGKAADTGTAKTAGKGKAQSTAAAKKKAERDAAKAAEAAATPDFDGDGVREGTDEGSKPDLLTAARSGGADDLKRIKGIGPKLETACNSIGVYHFDQIAAWSADEVAWVNANLIGFKGRVTRDKWVEQAKTLAAGGETEFSKRVDKGSVY